MPGSFSHHHSNPQASNHIKRSRTILGQSGLQLLPLSPTEFQARWTLSSEALAAAQKAASTDYNTSQLVLRVYSLPEEPGVSDFSNIWKDYRIDRTQGSAMFTLPKPSPKINAALGLINRTGQFSPVVRSDRVALPPLPPPPTEKRAATSLDSAPRGKELAYHAPPGRWKAR